jgi:MFS family permease
MTSHKGFYGWVNLTVLAILGVVVVWYLVAFGYFLPYLIREFGWNRRDVSFAATIGMVTLGLCGPAAGAFIVKYGARRAILLGNCLGLLGFLLLFFHSELWELFLGFGVLAGLAGGFGGLLAATTVINHWFVKKRSVALGIYLGSGGAVGIFMGPAMIKVIETVGWRITLLIMAGMLVVFAVILPGIFIRNKPQDLGQVQDGAGDEKAGVQPQARPKGGYKTPVDFTAKEAMRTPALWLLIAYFCMNMLSMNGLMTHMLAYFLDLGIKSTLGATALSVMTGTMAITQFAVGYLGSRLSVHSIAIGAEVLKIIGMVLLVFTHTLPFAFTYMAIFGVGFGAAMVATMNMFPNYFGASDYPKIMGSARLFWTFVGGMGAPLAGWVRDRTGSYLPAYQIAIFILVAGLICLIFAKAPIHPSLKRRQPEERTYSPAVKQS